MPKLHHGPTKPDKETLQHTKPQVALYVSCLVNSLRPNIGFDCIKLIESLGFEVSVPPDQTCCGQPGYNGGHRSQAVAVARHQIAALSDYDYIVVPSGSCAGMFINHYPLLMAGDPLWLDQAQSLANKTVELCQFLVEQHWQPTSTSSHVGTLAYHTSCSCRRETRSHQHGETLLRRAGYKISAMEEQEVCCGFGGSFSAKFDAVSSRMGHKKLEHAQDTAANAVVSADLGCLLHLESLAAKASAGLTFHHIAELLAGTCCADDCSKKDYDK